MPLPYYSMGGASGAADASVPEAHVQTPTVSEQDAQFHMALCAASGNKLIQRAANSFWLASKARREQYFNEPANGLRSIQQHTALRDAVAARDVQGALAVLSDHLGNVQRYWLERVAPSPREGREP